MARTQLTLQSQFLLGNRGNQFQSLETEEWAALDLPTHVFDQVHRVTKGSQGSATFFEFVVADQFPKDAYGHLTRGLAALPCCRAVINVVPWRGSQAHLIFWKRSDPTHGTHIDLDFAQLTDTDEFVIEHLKTLGAEEFDAVLDQAHQRDSRTRLFETLHAALEFPGAHHLKTRNALIALLLKLIFLIFVQRKGWLNFDPRYVARRMELCDRRGLSIMTCFLKPLFARLEGSRLQEPLSLGTLPRLGGGLFGWDTENLPAIDNQWFLRLFGVLNQRFSYTLFEEQEGRRLLGISPEILGHVFENLLLPEQRRRHGIYYTPPQIAQRQARLGIESLIRTHMNRTDDPVKLRAFLLSIRVLDPSCGSGTYLVGALRAILDAYLRLAPSEERYNGRLFNLKSQIVTQQLFGLDVYPMAARLAEVRLWLNMIQDIEISSPDRAPSLPNLQHHLRPGDFLYQQRQVDSNLLRRWPKYALLERMRARFPNSSPNQRTQLLRHIQRLEAELQSYLASRETSKSSEQQCEIPELERDRQRHERAVPSAWGDRFNPHILFSGAMLNGGFDLILGNPPWLSGTRIATPLKKRIRSGLTPQERRSIPGHADYSLYFAVTALRLLKHGGHLGLLLPGKLMQAAFARGFRGLVSGKYVIDYLFDYGLDHNSLFRADTFPIALGICRSSSPSPVRIEVHDRDETRSFKLPHSAFADEVWTLQPVDLKPHCRIADLTEPIHRGIVTNAKPLFTFRDRTPVMLRSHMRPLLRGRDIQFNRCDPGAWIYWPFDDGPDWYETLSPLERAWLKQTGKLRRIRGRPALSYGPKKWKAWVIVWKYLAARMTSALFLQPSWIPDQTTYWISFERFEDAYPLFVWLQTDACHRYFTAHAERGKDRHYFFYAHTCASVPVPHDALKRLVLPNDPCPRWLRDDLHPSSIQQMEDAWATH